LSKISIKKKQNNFTILDNTALKDKRLSWKAKGLLAYLLYLPDDWQVYITELSKNASDGLSSTRSAIEELMTNGYITREEIRINGKFSYDYTIYEAPLSDFTACDLPTRFNRRGLTDADNHTLLSTNVLNTNKQNTNKEYIIDDDFINQEKEINKSTSINIFNNESFEILIVNAFVLKLKELYPNIKEPNVNSWAKEIDKMIRIDKRSEQDIKDVLNFATNDSFWQSNILSTAKLRKHFDRLYIQMNQKRGVGKVADF